MRLSGCEANPFNRLDGEDILVCMERSDKALYEAKRTGRNKVVIADTTKGIGVIG